MQTIALRASSGHIPKATYRSAASSILIDPMAHRYSALASKIHCHHIYVSVLRALQAQRILIIDLVTVLRTQPHIHRYCKLGVFSYH